MEPAAETAPERKYGRILCSPTCHAKKQVTTVSAVLTEGSLHETAHGWEGANRGYLSRTRGKADRNWRIDSSGLENRGSSSTEGVLKMEIKRVGSQPSVKGPSEWFTGTVRIDPLFQAPDPAFVQGASVTFEPGARTAWHTHPLGQTLIVTAGCGRAQRWGGPIEEIRPGDVIWIAPGEKHWHGAAPTTAVTHIAIQEKLDGKAVEWMEHVSDEQYGK
jgi:quercetin dioxygenase-like cupin family protein